ncbi:MAG TPA: hypothetical protein DCF68_07715 [Cyanothece sp. UBA12306]|nr:hypothetical protein [Cyanothece sp. UBA12306]
MSRKIGRVPIAISGFEPSRLLDPYILDEPALIEPAEDFTVSINYISHQLFTKYRDHYLARQFDNDYFALLSQIGIGDVKKPIIKVHYLEHLDVVEAKQNLETIWAENVIIVEDFLKNFSKNQEYERIYLSFSAFCQGLGDRSNFLDVFSALNVVASLVGAAFPSLVPFTALGTRAIEGVNNLIKTVLLPEFQSQVKTVDFAFYPTTKDEAANKGEAPLQTGAYAFFFEEVELENLEMDIDGSIHSLNGEDVIPYIVINIKKEKDLAPGSIEAGLAAEVLETYGQLSNYPLTAKNAKGDYFRALTELGKTIRLASDVERYFDLKSKGASATIAEAERMEILAQRLQEVLGTDFVP